MLDMDLSKRDKVNFSYNLNRLLKTRQIPKLKLAQALGIHWDTVNKWCKGERVPSLELLIKICEFLNVSLDELVKNPPEEPFPGFWEVIAFPPADRYHKIIQLLTQEFQMSPTLLYTPNPAELEEKLKTEEGIIEVYNELRKKLEKAKEILQKYKHELEK